MSASTPATLVLRAPLKSDLAAWRALWDGYNAFYGRAGTSALPEAITRVTWERFFDPAEPVHALVAERDGELVGLAHYIFHRSTTLIGPTCYLQDLFASEGARGMGVGRALIGKVAECARKAGAARLYWQTHESNLVARRLYDKVARHWGFIVYRHDL